MQRMQQLLQHVFTAGEAGALFGIPTSTVTRTIQRGELAAERPSRHAPFEITREALLAWGAARGYRIQGPNGSQIDPETGEVLEPADETPTPIAAATAARARLAGVATVEPLVIDPVVEVAEPPIGNGRLETNVSRVLLPSAEAGLLEACRRLVALPESPQLWQALRAVLGVEAPQ